MRVAVQHTDPEHPNAAPFAFRLGRVHAHTDPITGQTASADEVMVALLDQARREYPEPGYTVRPERLSDPDKHGESVWQPIDETALRARAAGEPVEVNVVED